MRPTTPGLAAALLAAGLTLLPGCHLIFPFDGQVPVGLGDGPSIADDLLFADGAFDAGPTNDLTADANRPPDAGKHDAGKHDAGKPDASNLICKSSKTCTPKPVSSTLCELTCTDNTGEKLRVTCDFSFFCTCKVNTKTTKQASVLPTGDCQACTAAWKTICGW